MTESQFQAVRTAGFLLALGVAVALQYLAPHMRQRGSWRVNAAFWAINAAVIGVVCGACACTVARWAAAHDVGLLQRIDGIAWLALPATVAALDLVSYAWHRANHVIPFLWRFHQVHHSDPTFTASTALRFHPGELLLSLPLRLSVVAALGASPAGVVLFEILFAFANFFEHGDIDLPVALERRLGRVCITPALHRRHHSRQREELNTNFGTIFVFWDRLLGTHRHSSSTQRVRTGLPYIDSPPTIGSALGLPLRAPLWQEAAVRAQGSNR